MFPILPLLILFLLGPANAERLAGEGRLPPALLAVHRSMVEPLRATLVAPAEATGTASDPPAPTKPGVAPSTTLPTLFLPTDGFAPGAPTRAGPTRD